jgi:hypothetical protein
MSEVRFRRMGVEPGDSYMEGWVVGGGGGGVGGGDQTSSSLCLTKTLKGGCKREREREREGGGRAGREREERQQCVCVCTCVCTCVCVCDNSIWWWFRKICRDRKRERERERQRREKERDAGRRPVRSDICWRWRYLQVPLFDLATHSHSEQNTLAPLCRHLPHPRGAVGRTQPNGPLSPPGRNEKVYGRTGGKMWTHHLRDSNHLFIPTPMEAGGESVLCLLSLRALAHACAPGLQELFLQRNTSQMALAPGDRNIVQARYGCHPSQQTH